jgi:hypothetical protein
MMPYSEQVEKCLIPLHITLARYFSSLFYIDLARNLSTNGFKSSNVLIMSQALFQLTIAAERLWRRLKFC